MAKGNLIGQITGTDPAAKAMWNSGDRPSLALSGGRRCRRLIVVEDVA